jgi:hypothetical protein
MGAAWSEYISTFAQGQDKIDKFSLKPQNILKKERYATE